MKNYNTDPTDATTVPPVTTTEEPVQPPTGPKP